MRIRACFRTVIHKVVHRVGGKCCRDGPARVGTAPHTASRPPPRSLRAGSGGDGTGVGSRETRSAPGWRGGCGAGWCQCVGRPSVSTTIACSNPSGTSRRPKPRPTTIGNSPVRPLQRRSGLTQTASANDGRCNAPGGDTVLPIPTSPLRRHAAPVALVLTTHRRLRFPEPSVIPFPRGLMWERRL